MQSVSFLFERGIGAIVYCLMLLFTCYRLSTSKGSFKKIHRILFQYAIVLSIMAFFYIPSREADLTRLNAMGDIWVKQGARMMFTHTIVGSTSPVAYLLIYLCRLTGINGLLPFVACLISYLNFFYIINLIVERYETDASRVATVLCLFVMSSGAFISAISGIRTTIVYSIICRCFFNEAYKGKSILKNIPLYIIAVGLHSISIPMIIIRLFAGAFAKTRNIQYKILQIVVLIIISLLLFRFGRSFINESYDKFITYTSTELYFSGKGYVGAIIRFIFIIAIYIKCLLSRKYKLEIKEINVLFISILVLELVMIRNYVIFGRFLGMFSIVFLPFLSLYLLKLQEEQNQNIIQFGSVAYRNALIICSMLLVLSYLTGDLSAYKFFVIGGAL